jgi:hypothetical protein
VDGRRELLRLLHVGLGRLAPDQVGVGRVGQAARDRLAHARFGAIEALLGALAGEEALVGRVGVAEHHVRAEGIGAGHEHGGHVPVGVGGHLPAADVDGLQPGLDLLHGLVAGGGAEGLYRLLALQQLAQPLGTAAGERVLDSQRPPQPLDIVVAVGPLGIHDFGFAGALRPKRLTAEGSVADG